MKFFINRDALFIRGNLFPISFFAAYRDIDYTGTKFIPGKVYTMEKFIRGQSSDWRWGCRLSRQRQNPGRPSAGPSGAGRTGQHSSNHRTCAETPKGQKEWWRPSWECPWPSSAPDNTPCRGPTCWTPCSRVTWLWNPVCSVQETGQPWSHCSASCSLYMAARYHRPSWPCGEGWPSCCRTGGWCQLSPCPRTPAWHLKLGWIQAARLGRQRRPGCLQVMLITQGSPVKRVNVY